MLKNLVKVDDGKWVDPTEVIAVSYGTHAVALHLSGGQTIKIAECAVEKLILEKLPSDDATAIELGLQPRGVRT